jgi:hypothetical protein
MRAVSMHLKMTATRHAVNFISYVIPDCVVELNEIVREKAVLVLKEERSKIEKRFSNNTGFLDVNKYDKSIPEHFKNIIEHDNSMKALLEKIEEVIGQFLEHSEYVFCCGYGWRRLLCRRYNWVRFKEGGKVSCSCSWTILSRISLPSIPADNRVIYRRYNS